LEDAIREFALPDSILAQRSAAASFCFSQAIAARMSALIAESSVDVFFIVFLADGSGFLAGDGFSS
jgi:hypothetical protein